jgi:RND family efflux transporter MFP subunit
MKPIYYLLIPALLLVGCGKKEVEQAAERKTPVKIETVQQHDFAYIERSVGQIHGTVMPSIAAEVSGNVVEVYVEPGDSVKKGDSLIEIDREPYSLALARAKAGLAQAEAAYEYQKLLFERQTKLKDGNYISEDNLEASNAQLKSLEAQLHSAKAAAALAERDYRNTIVKAPFDGVIQSRSLDLGDFAENGHPVCSIATHKKLRVLVPFPEKLAGQIKAGLKVKLISPVAPDTVVETTIGEVKPAVSNLSKSLVAVIFVDNPGDWIPGASVNAEVITKVVNDAILVDRVSVVKRPAGNVVYVLNSETVKEVPVEIGRIEGTEVQLLKGINAGAKVVTDGAYYLSDGAAVAISE